jgi:hypothetical protein
MHVDGNAETNDLVNSPFAYTWNGGCVVKLCIDYLVNIGMGSIHNFSSAILPADWQTHPHAMEEPTIP